MAARLFAGGQLLNTATGTSLVSSAAPHSLTCWLRFITWPLPTRTSMVGIAGPAVPTTAVQIGQSIDNVGDIDAWTWGGTSLISTNGLVTFTANTWYNVAYTYDGTSHRLYIDGNLINTTTTAQQSGTYDQVFVNSYPTGGSSESGDFEVDDVNLFDRTLSQEEIRTKMLIAGAADGISFGALCRYFFNEGPIGANVTEVVDVYNSPPTLSLTPSLTGSVPTYVQGVATHDCRPPL